MSHREASPGPLAAGLRPVSREDGPLMVPVDTAYNPAEWGTFAVGFTTASGALTGLVFVAVSIRVREVLGDPFHRRRTESTFVILLAILTASLLVLIPSQGRLPVGIEMLVIGAALTYRATHTWPVVPRASDGRR